MMRRYARPQFLVFGVLPAVNAVALLIYGLEISTNGSYGEGETIPALVVMVGLCLLLTGVAAVKRGRDFGWTTLGTAAFFIVAMALIPAGLVLLAYMACAKGQADANVHGPAPQRMAAPSWLLAAVLLAAPWMALRILAAAYEL
jgi:uncharacterized membrane protein YhaH (DUF805 family)